MYPKSLYSIPQKTPSKLSRIHQNGTLNTFSLQTFQSQLGECHCEFDECAEYIFDNLIHHCPTNDTLGPTCALTSYWDSSDEIRDLFLGEAPPANRTLSEDLAELGRLLDRLIDTRYKVEEILTGETQNATTLAPLPTIAPQSDQGSTNEGSGGTNETQSTRRKRSYVPLTCEEVVRVMEDINDLITFVIDDRLFIYSQIHRFCNYILDTSVTNVECAEEEATADLQAQLVKIKENIKLLDAEARSKILTEAENEASRINNNYEVYNSNVEDKMQNETENFKLRQAAEKEAQARAKESQDLNPTTMEPYCVCPAKSKRRRRSVEESNDNSTTLNDEVQSPSSNSTDTSNDSENGNSSISNNSTDVEDTDANTNETTTEGAPTTTLLNTCICPDDEIEDSGPESNATDISNSNSTESSNSTSLRRRRSLEEIAAYDLERLNSVMEIEEDEFGSLVREKRGIKYRCNDSLVLGVMFLDLYTKPEIEATKCCCSNDSYTYPGELFLFTATIDTPWINALSNERDYIFKDWKKMVDQEVRYLFSNEEHSELMHDDNLKSVEFVGFKKFKGKVGVDFEVHLNRPHWDNDRRIERAFERLIIAYRNHTENNVLGHSVMGKYTKRDYRVENAPSTHRAQRIEIQPEVVEDSSGSGDNEEDLEDQNDGLPLAFFVCIPLGVLIILCIPFCIALRSKACLCRQCC